MLVDGKVVDKFQSTLPVGEATGNGRMVQQLRTISIHASRGGSDSKRRRAGRRFTISIHASRGGSDW